MTDFGQEISKPDGYQCICQAFLSSWYKEHSGV